MGKTVFFDLETTGFHSDDEILSIGMIDEKGEVLLDTLIKPAHKTEWKEAERVNHISTEMVQTAPSMEDIQPLLNQILADADMLIAYGIRFDYRFLQKWLYDTTRENLKTDCCLTAARNAYPSVSHTLANMMSLLHLEWLGESHSALPDADACKKVWDALQKQN